MNLFKRNYNHIELVCVINRELNTQIINIFHLNRCHYRVQICNYPPLAKVPNLNGHTSYHRDETERIARALVMLPILERFLLCATENSYLLSKQKQSVEYWRVSSPYS